MVGLGETRAIGILNSTVGAESVEADGLRRNHISAGSVSVPRLKVANLAINLSLYMSDSASTSGRNATKLALRVGGLT